ncbi:MAG: hypothetical protein HQL47_02785, partial [Gammaproteobacteria bacterium]|nr:hypothetical protein [Gammaproteobacteria bacterium]
MSDSVKPLLLLAIVVSLLLPGEILANRLKQPGLLDATVETSVTEVEKFLIKTGLEKGIELTQLEQIIELVRSNMIKVGHNPRVLNAMVSRVTSPTFLGTTLDGVFMLRSIADMAKMTDPEEAAASAAGTAVGYLGNVAGNVAVATALPGSSGVLALGGGFLPGLVVSLSAKAV